MKNYHDIQGDGGSHIVEQVGEQRARIERSLGGVRHLVAVGSGKGGVGKSTLTMRMASALRTRGAQVAVLDADLNGPSQARLGGLAESPPLPGERGLVLPRTSTGIGVVSMGSLVPESRPVTFDSAASGDSWTWRATKEFSVLGDLLAGVDWGELDYLLIDLPPGPERTLQYAEFLGSGVGFVLVTIPSDLARGVVARSAAALGEAGARIVGFVENMSGYFCPDCGTIKPLFPESGSVRLDLPCLGRVPFDPELSASSDRGAVEDPDRPAFRAIAEVTVKMEQALEAAR